MQTNTRVGVGGITVGFNAGPTPYHAFQTVLAEFSFGKYCPNPRSDQSALSATMTEKMGGRNRLIAGKGGRGKRKIAAVEVVDITRQQEVFNDYTPQHMAKVKVNGHGPVVVLNGHDENQELTDEFLRTKAVLAGTTVNGKLKEIMAKEMFSQCGLTGTYIPEAHVPGWKALAERLFGKYDQSGRLVEAGICGGEYEVTTVELDGDSIRCIRARLAEETKKEAERICMETLKGTLNADQVATRCEDADALLAKIQLYEKEFRMGLDDLRAAAEHAKQVSTVTLMAELTGAGVGI
jgi:hypothetical protein